MKEICAETAPFDGAIWDEFSEQHQHQSKKSTSFHSLFWCK
jgi:hypothetical protein